VDLGSCRQLLIRNFDLDADACHGHGRQDAPTLRVELELALFAQDALILRIDRRGLGTGLDYLAVELSRSAEPTDGKRPV
jgi:hypothetical protein